MSLTLYTAPRSSASYRVRIALNWKGLPAEHRFVNLRKPGVGEQREAAYTELNPQQLIPLLVDGDFLLNQSLAILEYLEELHPEPPLLPSAARDRARVRALAAMICCDVHPLQNLRVQHYLASELGQPEPAVLGFVRHFIDEGLAAVEAMIAREPERGPLCYGATPTLADVCLVPQIYNARRYACDLARYPTLIDIADACSLLPAFRDAAPEQQLAG